MKTKDKLKILILDDEKDFTEELASFFDDEIYETFEANTKREGLKILNNNEIDLFILDIRLPGANGLDILQMVTQEYPEMEVIIVSAHGDMDTVIKAMRLGAFDYLRKPFRYLDIQMSIERTQKYLQLHNRLRREEKRNSLISEKLEQEIERPLIGVSSQIKEVYQQAVKAAEYPEVNVLITGESGTGKEVVARLIHYSSKRKKQIFYPVNASSITESLMESEFFGHKKGAFTGADQDKIGFFEICDNGTLFLDEIADMPLNLQPKILRAIEEKKITRVGDTKPIDVDCRIISATNNDVDQMLEDSKFRTDLFHRLNVLKIYIPPLRERPEDIETLLWYFTDTFARKFDKPGLKIADDILPFLKNYSFPGNVRELKNLTERAVILCKNNMLRKEDFPIDLKQSNEEEGKPDTFNLMEQEISLIKSALKETGYNQKKAASLLGISRDALIRRMRKYNITIKKSMR